MVKNEKEIEKFVVGIYGNVRSNVYALYESPVVVERASLFLLNRSGKMKD